MTVIGAIVIAFLCLFGLFVGSFLNVVIYRLPRECLSVVKQTRSRCPRCAIQLRWFDNIPLFSWLILLRGRCRNCRAPISVRYPLVEGFTALCLVALAFWDRGVKGLDAPLWQTSSWALFAVHALVMATLIALSVIDLDFRILPDVITLPGIVIAPALAFLVPQAMPSPAWLPFGPDPAGLALRMTALLNGLLGAAAGAGALWGIGWLGSKAFRKPAMGLGDVKLYAAMGGLLGLWVFLVLPLASLVGSVIGIAVLLVKKDHYLPFGPFLALGMVATWLWGPEMFSALMTWLGH
ncbi:MAG: prepilin peptidase [Planctomycetes bacterium]|nr:prepilin peptidase [Planctomycetota bacterium]